MRTTRVLSPKQTRKSLGTTATDDKKASTAGAPADSSDSNPPSARRGGFTATAKPKGTHL